MDTKIVKINPHKLKLLDVNARFMRHETFQQLIKNIQADETLTSVPFAWRVHDDATRQPADTYEVLSGNHRVKAAIEAGLTEIDVMVCDEYLPPDRRIAIQLSHNSITGEDDPSTLKLLYDSISVPELRLYSGLDDASMNLLSEIEVGSISMPNLVFQPVTLLFLPQEIEAIEKVFAEAHKAATGSSRIWLNSMAQYDATLDALEAVSAAHNIKNTAAAMLVILEIFTRHLSDLNEAWFADGEMLPDRDESPLAGIFESMTIPAKTGALVLRAIQAMQKRGEVEHPAQALEVWARSAIAQQNGGEYGKKKRKPQDA